MDEGGAEIDRFGLPDFNPGWLSRFELPWQGDLQPIAVASLEPLGISQSAPLTTVADWAGMITSSILPTGPAQEALRQLDRWLPVMLPRPGAADRADSSPRTSPLYYRSLQRPRRNMANWLGIGLPELNVSGEREAAEVAAEHSDLVPSPTMQEHESEWTDLASPLIQWNTFAPVLDDPVLAHLQTNSVLDDLAMALAQVPVAISTMMQYIPTDYGEPAREAMALRPDSELGSGPATVYRALQARLGDPGNTVPLALSQNLDMLRAAAPEIAGTAAAIGASYGVNLIPRQLTRVLSDQPPIVGPVLDALRNLPILTDLQGNNERKVGEAGETLTRQRQDISGESLAVRPNAEGTSITTHEPEMRQVLTSAFPSSAAGSEFDLPAKPDKFGAAATRVAPPNGATPISPLPFDFTRPQPLTSAIAMDNRVPGSVPPPSLTLPLRRVAQSLAPPEPLGTQSESIGDLEANPILSNPADRIRSAAAAIGAARFTWHAQTDQAPDAGEPNPPKEINWLRSSESASEPPASPAPDIAYPALPAPPAMQVRRALSEAGWRGTVGESVTPGFAGEAPATTVGTPSNVRQTNEAEPEAPAVSGVSGGSRSYQSTPAPAVPDVNIIARQVYAILKDRLRAERERHDLYGR